MTTLRELVAQENISSTYQQFIESCLTAREDQGFEFFVTVGTQKHSIRTWFHKIQDQSPDIWASNAVNIETGKGMKATIIVNPAILSLTKADQKEILSHNFVELLKTFLDGTRPKAISSQLELVLFTAIRKSRGQLYQVFGDSPKCWDEVRGALKYLLVSDEELSNQMKQLRTSREKFIDLMGNRPLEAQETFKRITHNFATKWNVKEKLVSDRLYEYLIEYRE